MSKKSKKQRKAEREARRAAERRAERQRNLFTAVVIVIALALGGVLVWVSLDGGGGDDFADLLDGPPSPDPSAADEGADAPLPTPEPPPDPALDDRDIACDGSLPEHAGETKPRYAEPEQVTVAGVAYEAVLVTTCGEVVIDLDAERAPEAVNAFVFLATTGFYDGLEIFRHAAGINVLQTGSGTNQAAFDIGYDLPDELAAAEEDGYPAGSVAYANAGPGTSGSQFFLVYGEEFQDTVEAGGLQPIYTRFGMVTGGLDVLERMAGIPVDGEQPRQRLYLEEVTILADGEPLPATPASPLTPTAEPTATTTTPAGEAGEDSEE